MPEQSRTSSNLRQISALNFLMFATRGLSLPFITVYMASVGFTGTEIGLVVSISALMQLILTPLSHSLADRTGSHRRLFYGLQVTHSLAMLGLVVSPLKLWLGADNVLRESANTPSVSLLSQLTVTRLEELRRPIYGRIRAWGSFGWSVTTLISGAILGLGGYTLLFVLGGLLNLAMLPLVKSLPERTSEKHNQPVVTSTKRPTVFYLLLLSIALYQISMNASVTFGNIYYKRDLGATDILIGVIASMSALFEIPAMVFYDRFLKYANIRTLMMIGMLGMSAVMVGLSLLSSATPVLVLMLVRGTFYTLQSISMVLLISQISDRSNAATNQALAQVTAPGLAVLLTGPITGWIFDNLGPRVLLQVVGLLGFLAVILLFAVRPHLAARQEHMQALKTQAVAD